jgi:hypothetical protein
MRTPRRWTGRTLRVDVEGWIEPSTPPPAPVRSAAVADRLTYPEARSVTWAARAVRPTPGACTAQGGRLALSLGGNGFVPVRRV